MLVFGHTASMLTKVPGPGVPDELGYFHGTLQPLHLNGKHSLLAIMGESWMTSDPNWNETLVDREAGLKVQASNHIHAQGTCS